MADSSSDDTASSSLIQRVQAKDEEAWRRLARIYTPLVYHWARSASLQESDAADVVQEVFRRVLRGVESFQGGPDKNFRGWLWIIAKNSILEHQRKRPHDQPAGGNSAKMRLEQLPEWIEQDQEPPHADALNSLLKRALAEVRSDFQEATWQAFWRLTMNNETAADIGKSLGMSAQAVRQAKYRVLTRLRQELES